MLSAYRKPIAVNGPQYSPHVFPIHPFKRKEKKRKEKEKTTT